MSDLEIAIELLKKQNASCAFCKDGIAFFRNGRGILPLLEMVDDGQLLDGYAAADKVVGKAAAILFVLLGIKNVHSNVMSSEAVRVFERHKIQYSFLTLVDTIISPRGTRCQMEQAVSNTDDPNEAVFAIKQRLLELSKK